ncbi:hypothetical protein Tco_1254374 [Tanacetum coccineum]
MFYLYPSKDLDSGLRCLNSDAQLKECVECGKNDCVVHINLSSSVFELNEADGSDSDLEDDFYDYFSEDDSDTAFVDHFSNGEKEVFEIRNQKATPKPKQKPSKMIDTTFLTGIYNALDREEYVDKDSDKIIEDQDVVGDQFPIQDPSIKWKLMKSVIGERYESLDQLKRALAVYALAKGYKLYYEVNNPRNCMLNVVEIQEKGNVLLDYRHHGCQRKNLFKLKHLMMSFHVLGYIRSTYKLGVDNMLGGNNYFKTFYVCFNGVKRLWVQVCRMVIGLYGCLLKTICKGKLLSAVGRDGNNQIYPIAWVVVSVENKEI